MRRAEYEAQLALPTFPVELLYLWRFFQRLRRRKGGNGFGPSPLEPADIESYARLQRFPLTPWEVQIIEDLDDLSLTADQPVKEA